MKIAALSSFHVEHRKQGLFVTQKRCSQLKSLPVKETAQLFEQSHKTRQSDREAPPLRGVNMFSFLRIYVSLRPETGWLGPAQYIVPRSFHRAVTNISELHWRSLGSPVHPLVLADILLRANILSELETYSQNATVHDETPEGVPRSLWPSRRRFWL